MRAAQRPDERRPVRDPAHARLQVSLPAVLQLRGPACRKAGVAEGGDWGSGGEGREPQGPRRGPIRAPSTGGQSPASMPGKSARQCGAGLPAVREPGVTPLSTFGKRGAGGVCGEKPGRDRRQAQLQCQPRDIPRSLNQADGASRRSPVYKPTGLSVCYVGTCLTSNSGRGWSSDFQSP